MLFDNFQIKIFLILSLTLILNSGCKTEKNRVVSLELQEVDSFGKESLDDIESSKFPSGGEVFGNISDIKVSKDGKLYVLDAGFKKVVVFNKIGEIENIILGGLGKGPGEFQAPTAMTLDSKNKVWVYDYALQRASIFNESGQLLRTINLSLPSKSVVLTEDRLWLTELSSRKYYAAYIERPKIIRTEYKSISTNLNYILPINRKDLERAPHGVLSWIGLNSSGSVLIAKESPGIWFSKESGNFKKKGKKLVADPYPHRIENTWVVPAQTKGITSFGDQHICIVWVQKNTNQLPTEHIGTWLDVFTDGGVHTDTAEIPFNYIDSFAIDRTGKYLYVAVREPYPRVVKYQITKK